MQFANFLVTLYAPVSLIDLMLSQLPSHAIRPAIPYFLLYFVRQFRSRSTDLAYRLTLQIHMVYDKHYSDTADPKSTQACSRPARGEVRPMQKG